MKKSIIKNPIMGGGLNLFINLKFYTKMSKLLNEVDENGISIGIEHLNFG